ncbi:VOC family protein [Kitasatospora sp. NPDC052896]|uniref:VOC family protein n=1 Tax=Kitasatospora sp. NPDC052896 TaxID=3364061 RepID=UPI0037C6BBEA
MRTPTVRCLLPAALAATLVSLPVSPPEHAERAAARSPGQRIAVGPQYDSTHVYVEPGTLDEFTRSWLATFGGTHTTPAVTDVTPTPSTTASELILSPVGTLSVFDFQTPIPYPFGTERTGWLMSNFDQGVKAAKASGAAVLVAPFPDPIGRDAVIQFPGGINAQLYWHTEPPSYPALTTVPENRLYVSPDAVDHFLASYLKFSGGTITSDNRHADAGEIGLPNQTYRRIRITSPFGDTVVTVTDGHLPYPFGRELTGYRVASLGATLTKARAAGATVLWGPHTSADRTSALVRFPGGYIAEIHDPVPGAPTPLDTYSSPPGHR